MYIPQTGDWADEYVHHGYVLYDQLLYLQALREIYNMQGSKDQRLRERCRRLKRLIRSNYWFWEDGRIPEHVYHNVLYAKGKAAAPRHKRRHWMSFFAPQGYGYRFDALANVLASLLGVADDTQQEMVDDYIRRITPEKIALLPAFHPVIKPLDEDWKELRTGFSYSFKNQPYEFHNAGLWPMVTAFYVADLVKRNQMGSAEYYARGINQANALAMDGDEWSFPEYVHGAEFVAGGTKYQGWSAAAGIVAHASLLGNPLFQGGLR